MDRINGVLLGLLVLSGAIFLRMSTGLYPYSGSSKPPVYGDYEAQRHWMEITINLPIKEWYVNTSSNDLNYWGLDYPPLTAYHSYITGRMSAYLNSSWTDLKESRGHESYSHKLFMRYSVLVPDVALFFTAAVLFMFCYTGSSRLAIEDTMEAILIVLVQPSLLLIDYGHFQYNCISLGLALWGILGVIHNWDLLGAAAFCLAINYKQMELYHALPFFCYLLGKSCHPWRELRRPIARTFKLGVVVISTFTLCWIPFYFADGVQGLLHVLTRIFPFNRGLFEDKVASFWCAISVVVKLKQIFAIPVLLKLSLVATVLSALPSLWKVVWNPTPYRFILCLVTSSLSFFLFSFQVHEKSILLVTLPVSLLLVQYPYFVMWFNAVATFSMYPLLVKDGLALPTWAMTTLYVALWMVIYSSKHNSSWTEVFLGTATLSVLLLLCGCSHILQPPVSLPDLFPVLISCYSCCLFLVTHIYVTYLLYTSSDTPVATLDKEHKD